MAIGKPQEAEKEYEHTDDLKVIHGIGPGIENRLYKAGICSYPQLAALSPEEIVSTLGPVIGLTIERITNQDWIGQAKKLIPPAQPVDQSPDARVGRQHYATFTVELLLDEENNVRRTRAVYIQSGIDDAWAGWDEKRIMEFIAQQSGLKMLAQAFQSATPPEEEAIRQVPKIHGSPQLKPPRITGQPDHQGRTLAKEEPFDIILPFDLADMDLAGYTEIGFKLNVHAKALGVGSQGKLGEAKGRFVPLQENEVALKCPGLKEGIYRIQVNLALHPPSLELEPKDLQFVTLDGGLLRIY